MRGAGACPALEDRSGRSRRSVEFQLPPGAQQGNRGWYSVETVLEIAFRVPRERSGASEVALLTDGHMVAAVEFVADPRGAARQVWWATGEVFTGPTSGVVIGGSLKLPFHNYLQVSGVRPRANTLTLEVTHLGQGVVRSVAVRGGIRVVLRPLAPAHLSVTTSRIRTVANGGGVVLRYTVADSGLPAREVGIAISVSRPGLTLKGTPSRMVGTIWTMTGSVRFAVLRPRRYTVTITVGGQTGGLARAVQVVVVDGLPGTRWESPTR